MQTTTKKTILTTPTGSPPSAMIRVSVFWFARLLLLMSLGCSAPQEDYPNIIRETITDYICDGNCLQERYRYFSGQSVHLEIEPTGQMSQVIYNVDPQQLKSRPIVLNKMVKISGSATNAESYLSNTGNEHDNSGAFQDIIAIPVTNMMHFLQPRIQTVKSKLIATKEGLSYAMNLFSKIPYTLILNPSGKLDRAPVHINAGMIGEDGVFNFEVNTAMIMLTGRVISKDTDLFSAQASPIVQARVMQGNRLISSVGLVQKDGRFALEISKPLFDDPINQPIALLIEPISQEVALPRLKIRLKKDSLNENIEVGDINLGTLKKPVSVAFDIHGFDDDSTIANAFLYLRAKVGAGETIVKKQVNNKGKTLVENMYEGSYDIAVVPPSNSPFAMRIIKAVEFDSMDNTELAIDLQRRNRLEAIVLGPTGKPLSGAQLELSRIGEIGIVSADDIYEDNHFKFTAATNDEGKVCHRKFGFNTTDKNECADLLLDDGRYLAHIIPPAGTELSHKWIMFDFPEHNKFSVRIDHPEFLGGQILSPDGKAPVRHAFVTVYLADTNSNIQAKVIGTAMTDEKGYFKAFVSAPH